MCFSNRKTQNLCLNIRLHTRQSSSYSVDRDSYDDDELSEGGRTGLKLVDMVEGNLVEGGGDGGVLPQDLRDDIGVLHVAVVAEIRVGGGVAEAPARRRRHRARR